MYSRFRDNPFRAKFLFCFIVDGAWGFETPGAVCRKCLRASVVNQLLIPATLLNKSQ